MSRYTGQKNDGEAVGVLPRAIGLLRSVAEAGSGGLRLSELAAGAGMPRATTHRILGALVEEQMLAFDPRNKRYTLALRLFSMAAKAGNAHGLRSVCRPTLLRLTEAFGETFFVLVRDGLQAVCIDRSHGSFPIRSITEDIGGRAYLGQGQGPLAILAFLPENEQDEVIKQVIGHLRQITTLDEASLRIRIAEIRQAGYASGSSGTVAITASTTGIGVPIFDHEGRAVASLSLASPIDRLVGEREAILVDVLKREAAQIGAKLNPFDKVFRHAAEGLADA